MAHLLSCRLLDEACTADDLATVTKRAKACPRKWRKLFEGHERRFDKKMKTKNMQASIDQFVQGYLED